MSTHGNENVTAQCAHVFTSCHPLTASHMLLKYCLTWRAAGPSSSILWPWAQILHIWDVVHVQQNLWWDLCACTEPPCELLGEHRLWVAREAELLSPYQSHWPCLLWAMWLALEQKLGACCRATFRLLGLFIWGGMHGDEMALSRKGSLPKKKRFLT